MSFSMTILRNCLHIVLKKHRLRYTSQGKISYLMSWNVGSMLRKRTDSLLHLQCRSPSKKMRQTTTSATSLPFLAVNTTRGSTSNDPAPKRNILSRKRTTKQQYSSFLQYKFLATLLLIM